MLGLSGDACGSEIAASLSLSLSFSLSLSLSLSSFLSFQEVKLRGVFGKTMRAIVAPLIVMLQAKVWWVVEVGGGALVFKFLVGRGG
jgi:hypothetical protein